MSLLSRLFGGRSGPGTKPTPEREPVDYKGYAIHPEPIRDGNQWRVAARIEREVEGEVKTHHLIRADMLSDPEAAAAQSARKAKQMIDEQGDRIFAQRH